MRLQAHHVNNKMRPWAHFYMSSGSNVLARAYSREVDIAGMREELRKLREQGDLTLDQLAGASGLNRATIHAIENIKREPNLKPDLNTVERIVQAMGLTLSQFFARIEALQPQPSMRTTMPSLNHTLPPEQDGSTTHVRRPLNDIGALLARNTAALDELIEAVRGISGELRATREQAAGPGAHQPTRHARGGKVGR